MARQVGNTFAFKHGHTCSDGWRSPTYQSWKSMRSRCKYPCVACYENYGGRGITVCDRWETFTNFLADMGERPSKLHCISRIDNDGNYELSNCTWELITENSREAALRNRGWSNG